MTSWYKHLPTKSTKQSKYGFKKRQTQQYAFVILLLMTFILISLYEFYFTIVAQAKDGGTHNIFDTIISQLRRKVEDINKNQFIRNFDGQKLTDKTVVIVVQVHKRTIYLEALIQSLKSVVGISSTLLIFSHDYFSKEINTVVNSIDFAPVLQIFFPLSIQLYPNEFPGTSPTDCPWNIGTTKAKAKGCIGANTPDEYGHYRQGEVTQIKHHWWWKINRIFEKLSVTKHFNGFVLFLEEDHYLAPDALHTLRMMINLAAVKCPECNSFHIGNFESHQPNKQNMNKADVTYWNALGYSFNRTLWNTLHACAPVFCNFDDYNWDWSYKYTAQKCFSQKLVSLVVRTSRVYHTGDCGVHHQTGECDMNESIKKAKDFVDTLKPFLFSTRLNIDSGNYYQPDVNKGWGGWADPRDIQLCLNISDNQTSRQPAYV